MRCEQFVIATVLAASSIAMPAYAQGIDQACELHVWPSAGLRSVYYGWFRGGIVDGAVTGRDGYPVVPRDAVDTATQVGLLTALDLHELFKMPGHKTVVHEAALESRAMRTSAGRIAVSQSPCYAELMVDDVFFQQDVVTGGYLKILYRFRDFGSEQAPVRSFGTWAETKLTRFPPDKPEQNAAALAELHSAYKNNAALFAGYLTKPAKKRR